MPRGEERSLYEGWGVHLNAERVKLSLSLTYAVASRETLSVHVREIDTMVQESLPFPLSLSKLLKRLGIILTCLRARGAPSRGSPSPFLHFLLFPRGNTRIRILVAPALLSART